MRVVASVAAFALLSLSAAAQTPGNTLAPAGGEPQGPEQTQQVTHGPEHVRGTIVSFDGKELAVKSDDGSMVNVAVQPDSVMLYEVRKRLSDIRDGDFLGSAAVLGFDGKLHAQEVRIFPNALRGMGEGQYPMGEADSNRSMTNATVEQVMAVTRGGTLKLSYHGAGAPGDPNCTGHAARDGNGCVGETEIVVAPGVPIMAYVMGDSSTLVPGAAISMLVTTGPDGTPVASRLLVEHKGVKPI